MLPFLKKKEAAVVNEVDESIKRKPDEGSEYSMLDAVVEDLMDGLQKGNKSLVKSALEALVEHIQAEDEVQDEEQLFNQEG